MSRQPIHIGVIGLGIGRWHLESYDKLADARVVAICDADEQRLAEAGEKFGIDRRYTSYERLFDNDQIDAVSVCLPNDLHARVSIGALEAGKHVLCEKPLANTLANARSMVEAARKSDRITMVGMKQRFTGPARTLHRLIEDGALGEVYYGRVSYLRPPGGIPGLGGWFTTRARSGGGCLIDNGVHFIDLVWHLMGKPRPTRVSAATSAHFSPGDRPGTPGAAGAGATFDVEDFSIAHIHFANGATAHVETTWACFVDKQTQELRLLGTRGGATLWPLTLCRPSDGGTILEKLEAPPGAGEAEFDHFVRCIQENQQTICNFEHCLTVSVMLDALYRSVDECQEVEISESEIRATAPLNH